MLTACLALTSCELQQEFEQVAEKEESFLVVQWAGQMVQTRANAQILLFDSEEAWSTPHAKPVASAGRGEITSEINNGIRFTTARFKNLASKKYWIKVLSTFENGIEHNQNMPHILDVPLPKGSTTYATVNSKNVGLREYQLEELTLQLPAILKQNPGLKVRVTFRSQIPAQSPGGIKATHYDAVVTASDFPLKLEKLNISIKKFSYSSNDPHYVVSVEATDGSFSPIAASIILFDLVTENNGMFDQLHHKDEWQGNSFTIAGKWILW